MMRLGRLMTQDLFKNVTVAGRPVIATIEQQAGRAELGEDPWGPHRCELHLELKPDIPGADQADVQQQIRATLKKYPGITSEVLTFLGDRISETITGETAAVVVNLFGDNLDVLDVKAQEVARLLAAVPGAADIRVASPPGAPQVIAQLRPERLQQFGFQPLEVLDAMQTAYQGTTVAECYEGNRVFDVVVVLEESARQDPESIANLLVRNAAGTTVRLDALAEIFPRTGRYMVLHDASRRRQAVTCNVQGRDLTAFVADAKQKVGQISFPKGVYALFTGTAEQRTKARNEILTHSGLVGLGIILLLATVFRRWQNLLLVLANLPFAFVGGVLAVRFTGASMSMGSIVGLVTLFGITMRNSVMMISHFEHLVRYEEMTWGVEAAIRGASERVVPIVMTALVTGLGLLPIALGTGEVGREIEGPMAVVILGGLVTSTLLNLLVLPTLALQFGRFQTEPAPQSA
jgi:Cu/Ag efflux pump CusA